jgi:hypothetical protein
MTEIYFSDYFSIPPEVVEEHGAFDISILFGQLVVVMGTAFLFD